MKLDLHVHTTCSEDAINSPDWIMRMTRKRGLDGVAVTDHNTTRGWKGMQESSKKHGMDLILGQEVKVTQNGRRSGEILGLFLNEEIRPGEAWDVIDRIREQDGIAVVSHPFDKVKGFRNIERFVRKVDGIECFNARVLSSATNEKAQRFASLHGTGMTGGSDAHIPWEVGLAYTVAEASGLEGFRKALKRRETGFSGRMNFPPMHLLSVSLLVFKKLGNVFR